MDEAGSWTIDSLPSDFGLQGVYVDSDGGAIVAGSFVMLRRVARGPWERVAIRGKLQHQTVSGCGAFRIAVGYPHSCVVSNDGGAKWHNRNVGSKRKLDSIVCMSERQVFVAGEDGSFISNDAGKTFQAAGEMRYLAQTESGLYGVSPDWKRVLHRWDGKTWRRVGEMAHRSDGIVGAADVLISIDSNVLRSVDGGKTWTETLPAREGVYLTDIAAHMTGRVVVVGYGGLIAVSEDYGVTWTEHRPTDRNLSGVCIAPDEDIWAVGDNGVLVRSGTDRAGAIEVQRVALDVLNDGVTVDSVLRAASPVSVWKPAEVIGAAVHDGPVTAATFLDDTRAVTGDRTGRLVEHSRAADGRWHCAARTLGRAITGLAGAGDSIFAIVGDKLVTGDGRPIATPGKVSCIVARANRLAASGSNYVATWALTNGKLGKRSTLDIKGEPADLDLSVDGAQVAYVLGDRVYAHAIASGKATGSFRRKGNPRVRFTRGDDFYLAGDHYDVKFVSIAKGGGTGETRTGHRAFAVVTSARGTHAAALAPSDEVSVIDADVSEVAAEWRASSESTLCGATRKASERDPVLTVAAISDAGIAVVGDVSGEVAILDARHLAVHHAQLPRAACQQPALDPPLLDVATLACGDDQATAHALVLGTDHRVRVIDPDSGEVRAGPRLDVANVISLHGFADVIVVRTSEAWVGVDRRSGTRRWTATFAVHAAKSHDGALYGFEPSTSGPRQQRHPLYRLDANTGEVTEVVAVKTSPWHVTPTIAGLVVSGGDDEEPVLIDPVRQTVVAVPENAVPEAVDPSRRYVRCGDVIRDTSKPSWPIVKREVNAHPGLLLFEAGIVVVVGHFVDLRDLRGELVARFTGGSHLDSATLFATPRGEAIVTCPRWGPVRRWPVFSASR